MSGVPSAFILVLVEVLLIPEGVVIDLLRVVLVLVAGVWPVAVVEVVDFDIVAPGLVVVVIFDELLRTVVLAGGVVPPVAGAVVWAKVAEVPPSRLSETRKPKRRFIK